ncbi:MAG: hypothetical protein QXT53_08185 [Ignisphaera sp.]
MSLSKYLITSSTIAFLYTISREGNFSEHIRALEVVNIDDVQRLCFLLRKYIESLSSLKMEKCLATPLIGVAPFLARKYGLKLITNQIMVVGKRPLPTDPHCIDCLAFDSSTWITKIFRVLSKCLKVSEIPIRFAVYYDPVDQWPLLINYIPIIILLDFNSLMNINKCREKYIVQFTNYRLFKGLLHDIKSVESMVITPHKIDKSYFQNGDCSPITCLDPSKTAHYSYDSEYNFFEEHFPKDSKENGDIDTLFIEFWSSHISFEETNRKLAYIWFFKPTQHVITQVINKIKGVRVKEIKVVSPHKSIAELGATHNYRIWLSSIIKSIVMSSKPKITLIS